MADVREGKGTFYYVNGDKYVGDWKGDVQHGKGIYYFSTGDRYVGDYVDGERTGQGIYVHKNGDKYVGECRMEINPDKAYSPGRTVPCTKVSG